MNKLKEFYQSFGFIISFMFVSVLISVMLGGKALNKFLLLILTSQLLLNADKATDLISNFTKKPTQQKQTEQKQNSVQNGKIILNPGTQVNMSGMTVPEISKKIWNQKI